MRLNLSLDNPADYRKFLRIKSLPSFRFVGRTADFPDEYAGLIIGEEREVAEVIYEPRPFLFDYQRDIAALAIQKRKFCVFADCGLGKTLIFLEFLRAANSVLPPGKAILIASPLMVIPQTIAECKRFYGDEIQLEQVRAKDLPGWMLSGGRFGITNYEAMREGVNQGRLGALVLDESSMLKSHYGVWGSKCMEIGRGLQWKMCCTGTPAPNDRIEYANHAVFMDAYPTINSFLSRFFVNRGDKGQWCLKPHGLVDFYRSLGHFSIFLTNPATYGWKDHSSDIPPVHTHIHEVPTTAEQDRLVHQKSGALIVTAGDNGIVGRIKWSGIAKGWDGKEEVPTNKYKFIRALVDSWPDESTIIWCEYNKEQDYLEHEFPEAASIRGTTSDEARLRLIADFKAGRRRIIITKPRILGFGLNLQVATRQVFSGLHDSYEKYYQAVKRSNRVGSTKPLNVHIPVTDLERPMVDNVLQKADRVQIDTEYQERMFKDARIA